MKWKWVDDLRAPALGPQWLTYGLVLISTGLMLAVGWAAVYQEVRRERAEAAQAAMIQAQNRAIAFEQYVARTLEGADLVTRHIAEKYLQPGSDEAEARADRPILIRDEVVRDGIFGVVTVVGPDGDLLATSAAKAVHPANVSRNPVFIAQKAHRGTDLLISPPTPSQILRETFIYLSRRVLRPNGATAGFVGVQIRPDDLSNFIRSASFRPTDLISVIGLDGITRARREGDVLSFGQDLRGKLVMRMQMLHPNGSYVGPSAIDGLVRYFSHRRLTGYPIFVTAGISEAETLEPVNKRAAAYFLSMSIVSVVSLVLAALIILGMRQRQSRERALDLANRRLREAQRIAKVGDWECDLRTGAILWSDQLCRMYEREPTADRLHFNDFRDYLDDEGRAAIDRVNHLAAATGESQSCEFKAYLPSGAVSDRSIIAIPSFSETGELIGMVGTDQDVTSDKLVQSLQEQINHLSRVDAMNTMAATLAHELNQPLTAASNFLWGCVRLLSRNDEAARPMAAEAAAAAKLQVETAGDIIRRVRDMLQANRSTCSEIDLKMLIDESIALLSTSSAWSRKWIRVQVEPGAGLVLGDRVQIQQVLMNLIRNGCEAASESRSPEVSVSASPWKDAHVKISVTDNGPGIAEPLGQLFSPFHSGKDGGLGLGLSISRTIVEYHGGKIWVEKTDGSGTTMSFTIRNRPGDEDHSSVPDRRSAQLYGT